MKPRLLLNDTPVDELSEELFHTTAHLQAYPFLQPQTIQHEATIVDLNLLVQIEISLLRALMHAEARMVVVDGHIDILASAIDGTIRVENGRDRKSLVHQRYFNNVQPSRFKRPLLGEQLESMREWIPSLTAPQSSPTLQGYGTQLAERVVEADGTVRAEADARRNLAAHELGARKVFIDRLNAMRQALYGQLAELPHSRPDLSLPPDFAFRFFLRDARPRKQTITTLERDITSIAERWDETVKVRSDSSVQRLKQLLLRQPVITTSLVASTLGVADADFMAGRYSFSGDSRASVVNRGRIDADGGYVTLLGASAGAVLATRPRHVPVSGSPLSDPSLPGSPASGSPASGSPASGSPTPKAAP